MRKFLMILAVLLLSFGIFSCTGKNEIDLIFEENGGSEVEDITISTNSTSIELPEPTRDRYTFDGWFLDEDLSEPFTIAALLTQTGELTLYAKWTSQIVQYTITFESNGGSAVSAITQAPGTDVTAPTAPIKTDFTFAGWYSDSGLTTAYTFTTMPEENITLYAKWDPVVVNQTITFEVNGGSAVSAITQAVGSAVTAPTPPTKTGYTFAGWYSDSGLTTAYSFTTMPADAMTLYAKWTVNSYTITFEENGGTAVVDLSANYNTTIVAPTPPTKTGYTFAGWYSDIGLTTAYTFATMPAQNQTLYAKWTINSYTITFEEDGGTAVLDITADFNATIVAPTPPTKTGYTFAGWYSDVGLTTAYTFATMPAQNQTLYAKWTPNDYTISFEENGGSLVLDITQAYLTNISAPTPPTKEGYVFIGWYSDSGFTTTYTFTTMPAQDMMLYAKWDYQNYIITFVNAPDLAPLSVKAYDAITLPTATMEGNELVGWFNDEFFVKPFDLDLMPEENITIYAKWSLVNYIVNYETNGGTTRVPSQANYASEIPVPEDPTKDNFTFAGWFMDADLMEPLIDQSMPAHEITLYAKWVAVDAIWTIHDILTYQPGHVSVSGTITYKFPNPMNPGFYLTDQTGSIFVLATTEHAVGTMVTFEADFNFFEYTPQLTNLMDVVVVTEGTPIVPLYSPQTIAEMISSNPENMFMMGQTITIQGIIFSGVSYPFSLAEAGSGNRIDINVKSIDPMSNPFDGHTGEMISMRAIIHGYNMANGTWHILYDPSVAGEYIAQTNTDKIEAILDFGEMMLDEKVFYSTQTLSLPTTEEIYGAQLSFVTSGDHAAYFSPLTGVFQPTTIERNITLRMTVTLGEDSAYRDVTLILKPTEILTIDEFVALDEGSYGVVEGIVVFMIDQGEMKLTIIADETGAILPIEADVTIEVGKHVTVHGYRYSMMDLVILTGIDNPLVSTIAVDVANPLTPIQVTAEQFKSFDVYETVYWGQYFEITGNLVWSDKDHTFTLVTNEVSVPVMIFEMEDAELLHSLIGLEISIRGYVLPNFDDEPYLMFIYSGQPEDIIIDYTDQELVDHIATLLKEYLESNTYSPGMPLDLPEAHDIFDMTVTYEVDVLDATKVVEGMIVNPNIEVETTITLHATLSMNEATSDVDIVLNVVPLELFTIAELLAKDDEQLHYVKAVIMFITPFEVMIVADESGVALTNSPQGEYSVGDLVILQATKMEASGMTLLANDPSKLIHFVIAHDQAIPTIAEQYTVSELSQIDLVDPSIVIKYVEVMGQLIETSPGYYALIDNDEHMVNLMSPLGTVASTDMTPFINQAVKVTGLWLNQGELVSYQAVIFIDRPGDIILFEGQELVDYLADELVGEFNQKILRPGVTWLLPYTHAPFIFDVSYEVTSGNAELYNVTTGLVSDEVIESTIVTIVATITSNDQTAYAEFDLIIEPLVTDTIAEFLAGEVDDVFTVRGVVVLQAFEDGPTIIADETGYMFIAKALEVNLGDEIVVTGKVTIEMGMKLIWDDELTELVEIVATNVPSPLIAEQLTITEMNAIDMSLPENYGRYIETIGIVSFMEDSFFPLLSLESNPSEFIPYVPIYMFEDMGLYNPELIHQYNELRVVVRGFVLPTFDDDPEAPDRLLMVPSEEDFILDYDTDQEKMDALISLGTTSLEGRIWRPNEVLELPSEMPVLGATLVWEIIGDNAAYFDLEYFTFANVDTEIIIEFEVTATIGELTYEHVFELTLAPYPTLTIEEFYGLSEGEFGKLTVIVAAKLNDYTYILQEESSSLYLYAYDYYGLEEGDEIIIFGQHRNDLGTIMIDGFDDQSYYHVLGTSVYEPLIVTPGTLEALANMSTESTNQLHYYEVEGYLLYNISTDEYFLTDGVHTISLFTEQYELYDQLEPFANQDVILKFFNHTYWWTVMGEMWTGYIIDEVDIIGSTSFTEEEIAAFVKLYLLNNYDLQYKDGLTYLLPNTSPVYGGLYTYAIDEVSDDLASMLGYEITFVESETEVGVLLNVTITYGETILNEQIELTIYPYEDVIPFTPGELGVLSAPDQTIPEGEFRGLYIHEIERQWSGESSDEMLVYLMLPDPWTIGIEYYTLEYYDDIGEQWLTLEDGYGPITSYYDNFYVSLTGSMSLRAITDTGLISNSVWVEYTDIDTYFSGYSIDMSMWITDISQPFVGYGLLLDYVGIFTLDDQEIEDGYTLQWYRVNPYTFTETLISGATSSTYITTEDDLGYYLLLEIKGDEEIVGGMLRILIDVTTKVMNDAYVMNETNLGFDIAFTYEVSLEELEEIMMIYGGFLSEPQIDSITETEIPNVYHVSIDLTDYDSVQVYIENMVMIAGIYDEYEMFSQIIVEPFNW